MKTTLEMSCVLLLLISSLLLVNGGVLGNRKPFLRASKKVIVEPLFSYLVLYIVLVIENSALYHGQAIHVQPHFKIKMRTYFLTKGS